MQLKSCCYANLKYYGIDYEHSMMILKIDKALSLIIMMKWSSILTIPRIRKIIMRGTGMNQLLLVIPA